ncbi:MAG: M50 family metallopeptidase [Candidatus Beckwithbacteria bacterium]|nr:M50 family metallopeptidase [Candidatus Beckwithbacteria bacterium]
MAILSFLIILSILVFVHELGHFLAAKKLKVKVEEFGFGYPPRILGIKKRGTIYSLNLLPFGGFVRMRGEDPSTSLRAGLPQAKGAFFLKSKRVRLIILIAGVVMNFILGVVLFGAIYTKTGIPQKTDYLTLTAVAVGSPAEKSGLKPDDKILGFKGSEEFINYINDQRGQEIRLKIKDGRELTVIPRLVQDTPEGQGALGVGITDTETVFYPIWQRPFRGMWLGLQEALAWGGEILAGLGTMIAGLLHGQMPKDVAGPVGIYQISKTVAKAGFLAVLQFMGILSVNLAILNLLPLPALDGGRLLFLGIEAVTRKRIKPGIEQAIHMAGMLVLIGLMVLVTIGDIKRLMG